VTRVLKSVLRMDAQASMEPERMVLVTPEKVLRGEIEVDRGLLREGPTARVLELDAWAAEAPPPKPKNGKKPSAKKAIEKLCAEVRPFIEGTLAVALTEPRQLLALYVLLHEHTYGVRPVELEDGNNWAGACSAARRLVAKDFDGSMLKALSFVRWTWWREHRQEKRARADGDADNRRRIGWRLQFASQALLTDYRVAQARRGKTA